MTEKEAKIKLCPATFSAEQGRRCIGSACMAWRWQITPMDALDKEASYPGSGLKADGHCGLAGKP
jgi:hypothetical protein